YYRITGKSNYKEPYVPEWARRKAEIHAGNFMFNRERQIEYLAQHMDRAPIVVSPYDAELFGHWWFEGPLWLNFLFRKAASEQNIFRFTTPSRYLDLYPHNQPSTPCMSSWGNQGYNDVWLEGSNDWIYRHLHHAAKQMVYLATNYPRETGTRKRALDQAARELLLAQASDWAFIMKTGTMTDYAIRRTKTHIARFLRLERSFLEGNIDERWLADIEEKDNIFPFLHYSVFSS
ncbi:MAG: DUF1957 domain-containing protein, partial [Clostridia bacterium]|nr:DUF1957 domain-containing protein [Clostridia bacterium]